MKAFRFLALLSLVLAAACDNHDSICTLPENSERIDLQRPKAGQRNFYLGFNASDIYNHSSDSLQFTQDTLVMEVIGEDDFGIRIREYYTAGSPILSDPIQDTDTAFYSLKISNDSLRFDWQLSDPVSPRGRLFDYGVRYPMTTESYEFDKFGWKVFPTPDMPQFGVTGIVHSYQPIDDNFGTCKVRFDVGTQIAHIERPIWIYQPNNGLIVRYTEYTPGGYAIGFILK